MKKIYMFLLLLLLSVSYAGAQTSSTNYFVRHSLDRHKLNPAFVPLNGYIGIPVVGSLYLNVNSSLAANELFYPLENGKIGTFLHPEVSADRFLSTLRTDNYLDLEVNTSILSFGWFTDRNSFWTIDLSARVLSDNNIPKEFFRMLKVGMDSPQTTYAVKNLAMSADAYAQLAVGYSGIVLPGLRIGGKLKFLASAASAKVAIDQMNVSMGSDAWNVDVAGHGDLYLNGVDLSLDENGMPVDVGMGAYLPSGYGAALDLGIQYDWFDVGGSGTDLSFSASVLDLGFMSYGKSNIASLGMKGSTSFTGFDFAKDMTTEDLQGQVDALVDDLKEMVGLHEEEVREGKTVMLPTTVMAGIEYSFVNDLMSVGVLYKGRNGRSHWLNEMTASYNIRPADWFAFSLSYSFLNTWNTLGWGLYFNSRQGVAFFLNSDYTFFRYNRPGFPLDNTFFSVQLGLSVPIQSRKAAKLRSRCSSRSSSVISM